jgi:hypothetical protein
VTIDRWQAHLDARERGVGEPACTRVKRL